MKVVIASIFFLSYIIGLTMLLYLIFLYDNGIKISKMKIIITTIIILIYLSMLAILLNTTYSINTVEILHNTIKGLFEYTQFINLY